jgi:hypothetical protein
MRPAPAPAANAALTRRAFVRTIGAAGFAAAAPIARAQTFWSGAVDAAQAGLVPGSDVEQGAAFADALKRAENADLPLFLPPGRYRVAAVDLPERVHLIGIPGETRLVFAGGGPYMLRAQGTRRLRLRAPLSKARAFRSLTESTRCSTSTTSPTSCSTIAPSSAAAPARSPCAAPRAASSTRASKARAQWASSSSRRTE